MGQHDEAGNDKECGTVFPERSRDGEITELSSGERALIYRRRLGISQKVMCKSFKLRRREYSIREADDTLEFLPFMFSILPLEPHEKCMIWRRRSGWTQQECADLMDITRYWYNLMENGKAPSHKLEEFWHEG